MFLNSLKLSGFRNYGEQYINLNKNFNYIFGNNGEGKTNILEAISFISFGKSFINSSETDCVKFGCSSFNIEGVYENELETEYNVNLNYNPVLRKKTFHLNKEKVTRWTNEIFGRFPVVFLSPHSLEITYGNPSERRKFFDILLAQTSRVYLDFLTNYVRILKQKNSLLKNQLNGNALSGRDFRNLLNSINEKMTEYASEILRRRFEFLNKFKDYFEKSFSFLIDKEDKPGIRYISSYINDETLNSNNADTKSLTEIFAKNIVLKTNEEMARGTSVIGPHKDDYLFSLNKNLKDSNVDYFELKNFASQGEHKTFVIALKLAEYHFLKDSLASSPILLLDDLLSELDKTRISKIVSHLKDYGQIFLTTTNKEYSNEIMKYYSKDEINFFEIESGKVIEREEN